jgi:hypothetical protein
VNNIENTKKINAVDALLILHVLKRIAKNGTPQLHLLFNDSCDIHYIKIYYGQKTFYTNEI